MVSVETTNAPKINAVEELSDGIDQLGVEERNDAGLLPDIDSFRRGSDKQFIYLLKFLMGNNITSLRSILRNKVDIAVDLLFGQEICSMLARVT